MKNVLKVLKAQLKKIENKIETRENIYWDRSDNWQDSEKGQDWEDKTADLEVARDELLNVIENLETFLNIN